MRHPFLRRRLAFWGKLAWLIVLWPVAVSGQVVGPAVVPATAPPSAQTTATGGLTLAELVRQALAANAELAATRLDLERARARLRQAGLRPNPTVEAERTAGILDSPGEKNLSVGFSLPLELNGQRGQRLAVARLELEATEAAVADRERRLAAEVRTAVAEVLVAQRELALAGDLLGLHLKSLKTAEDRVSVGDAAPLDANLLRAETDRYRARQMLVQGKATTALRNLKTLCGLPLETPVTINETLVNVPFPRVPETLEAATDLALRSRPDVQLAKLNEAAAQAGLRLVEAQARPDVTAFTRFAANESSFDTTPIGFLNDRDRLLTFGVSVSLPLFNRNQGAKAEAAVAISQARHRREFLESVVKAEIATAFDRVKAAEAALGLYKTGVLDRSAENLRAIRGSYEVGAFRVTEVIAEQRRYTEAEREYTELLVELFQARAALVAAVGTPEPEPRP